MELEIEAAGVANGVALVVAPPQGGRLCLTIAAAHALPAGRRHALVGPRLGPVDPIGLAIQATGIAQVVSVDVAPPQGRVGGAAIHALATGLAARRLGRMGHRPELGRIGGHRRGDGLLRARSGGRAAPAAATTTMMVMMMVRLVMMVAHGLAGGARQVMVVVVVRAQGARLLMDRVAHAGRRDGRLVLLDELLMVLVLLVGCGGGSGRRCCSSRRGTLIVMMMIVMVVEAAHGPRGTSLLVVTVVLMLVVLVIVVLVAVVVARGGRLVLMVVVRCGRGQVVAGIGGRHVLLNAVIWVVELVLVVVVARH